jgi:ankyrin repeat protein
MIAIQAECDAARRSGCMLGWNDGNRFRAGRLVLCLSLGLAAGFSAQGGEIHKAVTKGDINKVVALLNDHPELLESKDNLGRTPLYAAVAHNQLDIATLLLANGANVNACDSQRHTPLIQSLWVYNHDKMVRLLLAKGADVNLSDEWKMTAVAYAAKQGQIDDAKILVANDANINFASGKTPLYFAIIGNHADVVELLLANGADPNAKVEGFSLLYYAKQDNYLTHQFPDSKIEALLKKYGGH